MNYVYQEEMSGLDGLEIEKPKKGGIIIVKREQWLLTLSGLHENIDHMWSIDFGNCS